MLLLLILAGCGLPSFAEYLALTREDGAYALRPREIPELDDPVRLRGALGDGFRGGVLTPDGYSPGGPLDVRYTVDGTLAVPTAEDGLVLWSFYGHLSDARADLGARGFDVEPLFPLDAIAYLPASTLDFSAVENAAYAPGTHIFVLFPDVLESGVPLAANAGVVRHELGHSWFHLLTVGDPHRRSPYDATDDAQRVRALNEGFADMVATLSLDAPGFISDSLEMPSRDVRGDAVQRESLYPDPDDLLGALTYDPYALGTVFASMAWDVRVAIDDPDAVLGYVIDATRSWAGARDWHDVDAWALAFVEATSGDPDAHEAACQAFERRFALMNAPEECR